MAYSELTYRDPLPSDWDAEPPGYLDVLGAERAAYWQQRDNRDGTPRFMNTSAHVLRAELDVALFAKIDRLQASVERLATILDRR